MIKLINIRLLFIFISASALLSGQSKKQLDSIVKEFSINKGLFITYNKGDELYFELGDSLLGKDLLMVTRYVQLPKNYNAYTNEGSK